MRTEEECRGPGFRWGTPIPLADGQRWIFPAPPPIVPGGPSPLESATGGLLNALWEAEDRSESLRVELALAIHLLGSNYDLGPEDFQLVLGFTPGSPALERAQRAFHLLAMAYLEQARPRSEFRDEPRRLGDLTGLMAVLARFGEWMHSHRSAGVEGFRHESKRCRGRQSVG